MSYSDSDLADLGLADVPKKPIVDLDEDGAVLKTRSAISIFPLIVRFSLDFYGERSQLRLDVTGAPEPTLDELVAHSRFLSREARNVFEKVNDSSLFTLDFWASHFIFDHRSGFFLLVLL